MMIYSFNSGQKKDGEREDVMWRCGLMVELDLGYCLTETLANQKYCEVSSCWVR